MAATYKEPNYMAVFGALSVLTVLEIGVIYLPIGKLIIGVALILLALTKAALVALYFMHLRYEKVALGVIALTPLLICTLLIVSLLPDLTGTPHESKKDKAAAAQSIQPAANASEPAESAANSK